MAEIIRAKCTVCDKEFVGKDCVKKAEEHEKIPVGKPIYQIGDVLLYPKENGYHNIYAINRIDFSKEDHDVLYNGMNNCKNIFILRVVKTNNVETISKDDLLNSSYYKDLRNRLLELSIDTVLERISSNKNECKIDKIFY